MKHSIFCTALTAAVLSFSALISSVSAQNKKTGTSVAKATYETDPTTGIQYHFYKHDKKGVKPAMGEVAHVVLTLRNDKDSVFFGSRERGGDSLGAFWIPLNKSFKGCLEEGLTFMAAGDSAGFKMNADSIFTKTFHARMPAFVKAGSTITFNIKLINFESQEKFMQQQQEEAEKQKLMGKTIEANSIKKYLNDNHLTITPDSNGLYILEHTKTTGAAPQEGDSVTMTYSGTLLDGKVFDASANHGGTFSFVFSQHAQLIRGWIIVLSMMREGEKVKVLIPSSLAYGERGAGGMIKGNTPLIFEMGMVKVTAHK